MEEASYINNDSVVGIIMDLRGNGGGIIDEAIQLVSYFVDKNTTVAEFKKELRMNEVYYLLNRSVMM